MNWKKDEILQAEHVYRNFGGARALDNMSLRIAQAEIVLIIGPNGAGKTTLINVLTGLERADPGEIFFFGERITNLEPRLDLLIIDELGYLSVSKQSAALFFKLISKPYEKTSTIITSNRPFEEWGEVFNDDVVAAAILDMILHHCHPFLVQGKSYRLKEIMGKD